MISGGFRKKFSRGENKGSDTGTKTEFSEEQSEEYDNDESGKNDSSQDDASTQDLQKEIAALTEKNKALENKLALAVADARNTINRTDALIAQNRVYAIGDFVKDFIDPFENLMIVFGNLEGAAYQGVEMVIKQFFTTLDKHGITRVYPLGEKFDHNFHQAISMEKHEDSENNTVLKVIKAGYTLHSRVLSPALVIVVNND